MNRGIARRTMFESEGDVRYFLSRVARAVRAGLLVVHAYCVMTTHYHLLVESPDGQLAKAMQRIQTEYSRYFNRGRRRDGSLCRGRYTSRRVIGLEYRLVLLRYIDSNPVEAKLVATPPLYPHGSARAYARARGPIWLERTWVKRIVKKSHRTDVYRPGDYVESFGDCSAAQRELVERRLAGPTSGEDPLDDLLSAAPPAVLDWMRRKARLADGTGIGVAACDPAVVSAVVEGERATLGPWSVRASQKPSDAWQLVLAGLLRGLCGAATTEIACRLGITERAVHKTLARHRACLDSDPRYAEAITTLAQRALRLAHPSVRTVRYGV
jgi:REP element-mobilizing transposase RayT